MTRQIILILIFGLTKIQGQPNLLDTIFYNIPFNSDLRATNKLLSENSAFRFLSADTSSTHGHHYISYTTSSTSIIPTKSTKTNYFKRTMKILVDGKMPEYCIKYASNVEFIYKSKSSTITDFHKIVKLLETKLMPNEVVGLVNLEGERYGYELYMGETKHCNYLTVTYGRHRGTNYINIRYH